MLEHRNGGEISGIPEARAEEWARWQGLLNAYDANAELEQVATAAGRLCAPTQQTGGQNVGGRARNQFSISPARDRAPDRQC